MPNYGWKKQPKCIFYLDRRYEFRKIRGIRARGIESRLYVDNLLRTINMSNQSNFKGAKLFKYIHANKL